MKKAPNFLSLALHGTILMWTLGCLYAMRLSDANGLRYGLDSMNTGNLPMDLPDNLSWMVVEVMIFLIILRPSSYPSSARFTRSIALTAFSAIATLFHLLQTWHAGSVNGWMAIWILGLFFLSITLLVTSLVAALRKKKVSN